MGKCKYCGKKAGLFKKVHEKCELLYNKGKTDIYNILNNFSSNTDISKLKEDILDIKINSFISDSVLNQIYLNSFDNMIFNFLEDNLISKDEEQIIDKYKDFIQDDCLLNKNGSLDKINMSKIIEVVMNGNLPNVNFNISIPFNLGKKEKILWVCNAEYYKLKTRTTYVGGSKGVSVKIVKGIYYRQGAFKGERVQTEESVYSGKGLFAISNKYIYFGGQKPFRIKIDKIVSIKPYEDGVTIQKDGVTAMPQTFKGVDGWFIQNLIHNLNKL